MIKPNEAEIMAPVGSYESLAAAINAGCDSIYFGITQLNMRARSASNMTMEDLKEVARICHENKVKAYLTVNTLVYGHELNVMQKIVDAAKENGIDAIIAADFAVLQYCNEIDMPVHISTQISISNYDTVKFFSKMTNRVVLARELTIDQIKDIYGMLREVFSSREERLAFSELVQNVEGRDKMATFVPLLHLDSQHRILLEQEGHLEEIWIWLKSLHEKKNKALLEVMRKEVEAEIETADLEFSDEEIERAGHLEEEFKKALDGLEEREESFS